VHLILASVDLIGLERFLSALNRLQERSLARSSSLDFLSRPGYHRAWAGCIHPWGR
jgi:hypothetical protein